MFHKKFWADALERIISSMAGVLVTGGVFDVVSQDFQTTIKTKLLMSGAMGVFTLLKCLAATTVGAENTAALLPAGPDTEEG